MSDPSHRAAALRAQTFRSYDLEDSSAGQEFDAIVQQAAAAVETPMSLLSLLDGNRQWYRAKLGIKATETPITSSFCVHAIRGSGILFVGDATQDDRFAHNPLVTGKPHIRFYAGATLHLDGVRVGTLCVLDDQPRGSLSKLQEKYLTYLAERTSIALEAFRR